MPEGCYLLRARIDAAQLEYGVAIEKVGQGGACFLLGGMQALVWVNCVNDSPKCAVPPNLWTATISPG